MTFYRARWWCAAAALVLLLPGVRVWNHYHQPRLLHPGDRLTPLALSELTGQRFVLAPTGHVQVINIFATWCTPCRDEMPGFASAAQRLRARGIDVIGIDQAENGAQVARFKEEFKIGFPLYIDTSGITHAALGARLIPTTILVGSDGRIKWIHPGPVSPLEILTLASAKDQG